jgi:hypothetical protein
MYCGEVLLVKRTREAIGATHLRCRSWKCELCAPNRRKELIAEAFHGKPTRFITLTVNPALFENPNQRARELVNAWRLCRKRAMRHYNMKQLPFLAVIEETERGEPHLHILARFAWIDQRWLSKTMEELIGAPIVDVRVADNQGRVAAYVAKYVGKNPHQFGTLKRYWSSQDWNLEEDQTEDRKTQNVAYERRLNDSLASWIERMELMGYEVERTRRWAWVHAPPHNSPNGLGWLDV